MSDIANAIMDDLWANGFVPGDKVLQLITKHVVPVEQELAAAREQLREQTKSFCTHCGKLFPKGTDGIEQFRAHIAECNSHPLQPLAQELAAARELLRVVLAVVQYNDIRFPGRNQWLAEAAAAAGGEK